MVAAAAAAVVVRDRLGAAMAAAVPVEVLPLEAEFDDADAVDDGDVEDDDDDSTPRRPSSASPGWLAGSSSPASSTAGGGMEGLTGFAMWKSLICGRVLGQRRAKMMDRG